MRLENNVNSDVRRERHAKLHDLCYDASSSEKPTLRAVAHTVFCRFFGRLTRSQSNAGIASDLFIKTVAVTVAFLMIACFMPLYQISEGSPYEGEFYDAGILEEPSEFALDQIATEDGFLLKPSVSSTSGGSGFSEIFTYTVQPGDTLSSIADQFQLKKETILWENEIYNANRIRPGMTLKILPVNGVSHVIKKGDTVDKIAKKYKVDKETIVTQNRIEGELVAGAALIIPGATKELPTYVASSSGAPASGVGYNYDGPVTGRLIWPTSKGAKLTQGFSRKHYALDIANRAKGPIYAAASGKVVKADYGWNGGYGNYVIIDHGNGMQTLYGHNEKLYVEKGQYVDQGQTIAWMGNSGRVYGATGIHVHFEVRINGVKYNPMTFF